MEIIRRNFQVKSGPSIRRYLTFTLLESNPIAPSSVPAGQIYLQNPGKGKFLKAYAIGRINTKKTKITYLKYERIRVTLLFLSFGVGILCKSSCIRPNGQRKPHIQRPKISPYSIIMPNTKYGALFPLADNEFWSAPRGQAPDAPGQE